MIIVAVPDLEALLAGQTAVPPVLGALLGRSQDRPLQRASWAPELVVGRAVPVAPLTRLFDAAADRGGIWLRADPVRLTPDLNAVWITPGASLALDHPLAVDLREALAEAGLVFDLPHPARGYLRLESVPECRFVPPEDVAGESLDYVLPSGPDGKFWRRVLNDCQVLAHQHQRDGNPCCPGGLWFWGAGKLPPASDQTPRVQQVFGRDPVWHGLATWLGLDHAPLLPAPGELPDASLAAWLPDPALERAGNLEALDAWLKPLWRRLRLGKLDALEIAGRARVWRITPRAAWQFWRRSGFAVP